MSQNQPVITNNEAISQLYSTKGLELQVCLELAFSGEIELLIQLLSIALDRRDEYQTNLKMKLERENDILVDMNNTKQVHPDEHILPGSYYQEEEVLYAFGLHITSPAYGELSTQYWLPLWAMVNQHILLIDLFRVLRTKHGSQWNSTNIKDIIIDNEFLTRRDELVMYYAHINTPLRFQQEFLLVLELLLKPSFIDGKRAIKSHQHAQSIKFDTVDELPDQGTQNTSPVASKIAPKKANFPINPKLFLNNTLAPSNVGPVPYEEHLSKWLGTRNEDILSILPFVGIEYPTYRAFCDDFLKNVYIALLKTPQPFLLFLLHHHNNTMFLYSSQEAPLRSNEQKFNQYQYQNKFKPSDMFIGPSFISHRKYVRNFEQNNYDYFLPQPSSSPQNSQFSGNSSQNYQTSQIDSPQKAPTQLSNQPTKDINADLFVPFGHQYGSSPDDIAKKSKNPLFERLEIVNEYKRWKKSIKNEENQNNSRNSHDSDIDSDEEDSSKIEFRPISSFRDQFDQIKRDQLKVKLLDVHETMWDWEGIHKAQQNPYDFTPLNFTDEQLNNPEGFDGNDINGGAFYFKGRLVNDNGIDGEETESDGVRIQSDIGNEIIPQGLNVSKNEPKDKPQPLCSKTKTPNSRSKTKTKAKTKKLTHTTTSSPTNRGSSSIKSEPSLPAHNNDDFFAVLDYTPLPPLTIQQELVKNGLIRSQKMKRLTQELILSTTSSQYNRLTNDENSSLVSLMNYRSFIDLQTVGLIKIYCTSYSIETKIMSLLKSIDELDAGMELILIESGLDEITPKNGNETEANQLIQDYLNKINHHKLQIASYEWLLRSYDDTLYYLLTTIPSYVWTVTDIMLCFILAIERKDDIMIKYISLFTPELEEYSSYVLKLWDPDVNIDDYYDRDRESESFDEIIPNIIPLLSSKLIGLSDDSFINDENASIPRQLTPSFTAIELLNRSLGELCGSVQNGQFLNQLLPFHQVLKEHKLTAKSLEMNPNRPPINGNPSDSGSVVYLPASLTKWGLFVSQKEDKHKKAGKDGRKNINKSLLPIPTFPIHFILTRYNNIIEDLFHEKARLYAALRQFYGDYILKQSPHFFTTQIGLITKEKHILMDPLSPEEVYSQVKYLENVNNFGQFPALVKPGNKNGTKIRNIGQKMGQNVPRLEDFNIVDGSIDENSECNDENVEEPLESLHQSTPNFNSYNLIHSSLAFSDSLHTWLLSNSDHSATTNHEVNVLYREQPKYEVILFFWKIIVQELLLFNAFTPLQSILFPSLKQYMKDVDMMITIQDWIIDNLQEIEKFKETEAERKKIELNQTKIELNQTKNENEQIEPNKQITKISPQFSPTPFSFTPHSLTTSRLITNLFPQKACLLPFLISTAPILTPDLIKQIAKHFTFYTNSHYSPFECLIELPSHPVYISQREHHVTVLRSGVLNSLNSIISLTVSEWSTNHDAFGLTLVLKDVIASHNSMVENEGKYQTMGNEQHQVLKLTQSLVLIQQANLPNAGKHGNEVFSELFQLDNVSQRHGAPDRKNGIDSIDSGHGAKKSNSLAVNAKKIRTYSPQISPAEFLILLQRVWVDIIGTIKFPFLFQSINNHIDVLLTAFQFVSVEKWKLAVESEEFVYNFLNIFNLNILMAQQTVGFGYKFTSSTQFDLFNISGADRTEDIVTLPPDASTILRTFFEFLFFQFEVLSPKLLQKIMYSHQVDPYYYAETVNHEDDMDETDLPALISPSASETDSPLETPALVDADDSIDSLSRMPSLISIPSDDRSERNGQQTHEKNNKQQFSPIFTQFLSFVFYFRSIPIMIWLRLNGLLLFGEEISIFLQLYPISLSETMTCPSISHHDDLLPHPSVLTFLRDEILTNNKGKKPLRTISIDPVDVKMVPFCLAEEQKGLYEALCMCSLGGTTPDVMQSQIPQLVETILGTHVKVPAVSYQSLQNHLDHIEKMRDRGTNQNQPCLKCGLFKFHVSPLMLPDFDPISGELVLYNQDSDDDDDDGDDDDDHNNDNDNEPLGNLPDNKPKHHQLKFNNNPSPEQPNRHQLHRRNQLKDLTTALTNQVFHQAHLDQNEQRKQDLLDSIDTTAPSSLLPAPTRAKLTDNKLTQDAYLSTLLSTLSNQISGKLPKESMDSSQQGEIDENLAEYMALLQWRSHERDLVELIDMFSAIINVLVDLAVVPLSQRNDYLDQINQYIMIFLECFGDIPANLTRILCPINTLQQLLKITKEFDFSSPSTYSLRLLEGFKHISTTSRYDSLDEFGSEYNQINLITTHLTEFDVSYFDFLFFLFHLNDLPPPHPDHIPSFFILDEEEDDHQDRYVVKNGEYNDDEGQNTIPLSKLRKKIQSLQTEREQLRLIELHGRFESHTSGAIGDNATISPPHHTEISLMPSPTSFLLLPGLFTEALKYAVVPLVGVLQALIPAYQIDINLSSYLPAISQYNHVNSRGSTVVNQYQPKGPSLLLQFSQQDIIVQQFLSKITTAFVPFDQLFGSLIQTVGFDEKAPQELTDPISSPITSMILYPPSIPIFDPMSLVFDSKLDPPHISSFSFTNLLNILDITAKPLLIGYYPSTDESFPADRRPPPDPFVLIDLRLVNIVTLLRDIDTFMVFLNSDDCYMPPIEHVTRMVLTDDNADRPNQLNAKSRKTRQQQLDQHYPEAQEASDYIRAVILANISKLSRLLTYDPCFIQQCADFFSPILQQPFETERPPILSKPNDLVTPEQENQARELLTMFTNHPNFHFLSTLSPPDLFNHVNSPEFAQDIAHTSYLTTMIDTLRLQHQYHQLIEFIVYMLQSDHFFINQNIAQGNVDPFLIRDDPYNWCSQPDILLTDYDNYIPFLKPNLGSSLDLSETQSFLDGIQTNFHDTTQNHLSGIGSGNQSAAEINKLSNFSYRLHQGTQFAGNYQQQSAKHGNNQIRTTLKTKTHAKNRFKDHFDTIVTPPTPHSTPPDLLTLRDDVQSNTLVYNPENDLLDNSSIGEVSNGSPNSPRVTTLPSTQKVQISKHFFNSLQRLVTLQYTPLDIGAPYLPLTTLRFIDSFFDVLQSIPVSIVFQLKNESILASSTLLNDVIEKYISYNTKQFYTPIILDERIRLNSLLLGDVPKNLSMSHRYLNRFFDTLQKHSFLPKTTSISDLSKLTLPKRHQSPLLGEVIESDWKGLVLNRAVASRRELQNKSQLHEWFHIIMERYHRLKMKSSNDLIVANSKTPQLTHPAPPLYTPSHSIFRTFLLQIGHDSFDFSAKRAFIRNVLSISKIYSISLNSVASCPLIKKISFPSDANTLHTLQAKSSLSVLLYQDPEQHRTHFGITLGLKQFKMFFFLVQMLLIEMRKFNSNPTHFQQKFNAETQEHPQDSFFDQPPPSLSGEISEDKLNHNAPKTGGGKGVDFEHESNDKNGLPPGNNNNGQVGPEIVTRRQDLQRKEQELLMKCLIDHRDKNGMTILHHLVSISGLREFGLNQDDVENVQQFDLPHNTDMVPIDDSSVNKINNLIDSSRSSEILETSSKLLNLTSLLNNNSKIPLQTHHKFLLGQPVQVPKNTSTENVLPNSTLRSNTPSTPLHPALLNPINTMLNNDVMDNLNTSTPASLWTSLEPLYSQLFNHDKMIQSLMIKHDMKYQIPKELQAHRLKFLVKLEEEMIYLKSLEIQDNIKSDDEIQNLEQHSPNKSGKLSPNDQANLKIMKYLDILEDRLDEYDKAVDNYQTDYDKRHSSRPTAVGNEEKLFLGQVTTIQEGYQNDPLLTETRQMVRYLRTLHPQTSRSNDGNTGLSNLGELEIAKRLLQGGQAQIPLLLEELAENPKKQQDFSGNNGNLSVFSLNMAIPGLASLLSGYASDGATQLEQTNDPIATSMYLDILINALQRYRAEQYRIRYQQEQLSRIFHMFTRYSLIGFDFTPHILAFIRSIFHNTYDSLSQIDWSHEGDDDDVDSKLDKEKDQGDKIGKSDGDYIDYLDILQRLSKNISISTPLSAIFRPPDTEDIIFGDQDLI